MTIMIIYLQKCFRAANFIILNYYFSAKNQNQLLLVTDSSFHALTLFHEIGIIWLVAHNLNNLHFEKETQYISLFLLKNLATAAW